MSEWNMLDKFIAKIRYKVVEKYVPVNGIMCDIGCGQKADFLRRSSAKIKQGYGFDFKINDQIIGNIVIKNNKEMLGTELETESVDVVFMIALLEHLEDPSTMLIECNRILKPRGGKSSINNTNKAREIFFRDYGISITYY